MQARLPVASPFHDGAHGCAVGLSVGVNKFQGHERRAPDTVGLSDPQGNCPSRLRNEGHNMAGKRGASSGPPFLKTVLAGIIVLVVGGLILAYLQGWMFQEGSSPRGPESTGEGHVDPFSRNSTLSNHQSRVEISSVRINRALEDYDTDIAGLKRDFRDSSAAIAGRFSKSGLLASGAFIKALMDLSRATKEEVYQRFVELDRSIQDILIADFGKPSLGDMGQEFHEQLSRLKEKESQLKQIYLMLENHPKEWELKVIGEYRATRHFRLTDDP